MDHSPLTTPVRILALSGLGMLAVAVVTSIVDGIRARRKTRHLAS